MTHTVFKALKKDHNIQRKLLNELVLTTRDPEKRKYLFYNLKYGLKIHDDEEHYFYKSLTDAGNTQSRTRHSIAEHYKITWLEAQINKDMSPKMCLP